MSPAAIATLTVIGVLVVSVASILIVVLVTLRHITDTLGKVTFGVRAIAARVQPVGPLLDDINGDVLAMVDAVESLTPGRNADGRRVSLR